MKEVCDHRAFPELQAKLGERWELLHDGSAKERRDIVVVPSLSLEGIERISIDGINHYEERMLFTLNLLRQPSAHVTYITSRPIHPAAVDYVLSLIKSSPIEHLRRRLTMVSLYDGSLLPLSQKILRRPRVIDRIRESIQVQSALMTCFTVSDAEQRLATRLGIPLYGVHPDLLWLGTKSGSRWAFRKAGVPLLSGVEDLRSEGDLVNAICDLWEDDPRLQRLVIKQNSGFSGHGNAILDLGPLRRVAPDSATPRSMREDAVAAALETMRFVDPGHTWSSFRAAFEANGGIVEVFVDAPDKRAPSCQMRICPSGGLDLLSTHDQLVDGRDGQIYAGCRFPADEEYRMAIQNDALKVGRVLEEQGSVGRLAVDFICTKRRDGTWQHHADETNLRMGGTTHPMMLLRMMAAGQYDPETGLYRTGGGKPQYYVATDSMQAESYKGLLIEDVLDIAAEHGLHYQTEVAAGVLFHFTGALSEFGKLGITAIGKCREEADDWFARTRETLDRETCGD